MIQRIDFEAVTARGATIRTFDTLDLARAWVGERKAEFPGLHVEEVVTTVTRRRAYQPRLTLVGAA